MFEVLVVEAVAHEVSQIRNDSFGTFLFQKLSQMIVGSRKEFYQDLTYDTDFGFFKFSSIGRRSKSWMIVRQICLNRV